MTKIRSGLKTTQKQIITLQKLTFCALFSSVVGIVLFFYLTGGKVDSSYAAPPSGETHDIDFNKLPFTDKVTGTVINDYHASTVLSGDGGIRRNASGGAAGFDIQIPGSWIGTTSTTLFFVFRKMENDATMIIRGSNLRIWMQAGRLHVRYTTTAGVITSNVTTNLANSNLRQKYDIGFTYDENTGIGRLWVDNGIIWENNGPDNTPLLYDVSDMVQIGTEMDGSGVANVGVLYNFKSFPTALDLSTTPLPVELLFFKGESQKEKVKLSWATALEENFDYFAVERSADLKEWQEIGQVNGAGNSSKTNEYSLIDENPIAKTLYYRLKAIDFNGEFEYFKVVSVHVASFSETLKRIKVGPNPFQDKLEISYYSELIGTVDCVFYNFKGELVDTQKLTVDSGFNNLTVFPDPKLPKGNYILNLLQDGIKIESFKLKKN